MAAVVVGLALGVTGYALSHRGQSAPTGTTQGSSAARAGGAVATAAGAANETTMAPCPSPTTLAVPTAYVQLWKSVAVDYARTRDAAATCTPLSIVAPASGEVAAGGAGLQGLDGWIPEDAAWADQLSTKVPTAIAGVPTVLGSTPVMLVLPAPMAQAAGVSRGALPPATLRDLITLTKTWADLGHPEWGTLRIALPEPGASVTGSLGFAALATIATNGQVPASIDYANPTPEQLAVIRVEHRVAATSPDDAAVLQSLGPLTAHVGATDPGGPGAWVTTEAALVEASTTTPAGQRVAVPLGDGSAADRPALVRLAQRPANALDDFTAYLRGSSGAAAMSQAGLRVGTASPAPERLTAAGVTMPATLAAPRATSSEEIWRASATFTAMHVRLSSLVTLDCSGSMTATFPGSTVRKIDLVAALAKQTLAVASPRARSGVVTFQTDNALDPKIAVAARLLPNGDDDNGVPHSTRVLDAVTGAQVGGGTPLFEAILTGYREAAAGWDPGYVNQLVVLTDGSNRDSSSRLNLAELLRQLAALADPKRPVKVILLGYGQDADMATLQAIASATGGKAVAVPTLSSVADAAREALFTP